jgi:hypothetical protein
MVRALRAVAVGDSECGCARFGQRTLADLKISLLVLGGMKHTHFQQE